MKYTKRIDGRKFDEARKMEAKVGIIDRADGSAMFRFGKTIAIAAVYGPRELFPSFQQNAKEGILRVTYDMLSFSVSDRKRPGPSRRSTEISMVMEHALKSVLDLKKMPYTGVDLYVYILQADAGTRTAALNAASMASANAGLTMRDLVSSVAMGKIGDKICVDIDKDEEDFEGGATDIPLAFSLRDDKVVLLQLDGNVSRKDLNEAIKAGKKSCEKIYEIQKNALKDFYKEKKK